MVLFPDIRMSVPQINNGVVDNKGIEASLAWDDNIGNFKYHLGGQFTFTRNKIKNRMKSIARMIISNAQEVL